LAFCAFTTSRQARTRSAERSTGFSQKIALPACAERSMRSACVSVGEQIATASMSFAARISSTVPTLAPVAAASACAALASASATSATAESPRRAILPP
jgi:hypothetical protein